MTASKWLSVREWSVTASTTTKTDSGHGTGTAKWNFAGTLSNAKDAGRDLIGNETWTYWTLTGKAKADYRFQDRWSERVSSGSRTNDVTRSDFPALCIEADVGTYQFGLPMVIVPLKDGGSRNVDGIFLSNLPLPADVGPLRGKKTEDGTTSEWTISPTAAQDPIRRIQVWINSFIPEHVPGVTVTVPGTGVHAGKTMIPSTFWGDCFLTDQRGFDESRTAKSRMHSEFTIDVLRNKITNRHSCGVTTEVDCGDGDEEGTGKAKPTGLKFNVADDDTYGEWVVDYRGAASNPLVAVSAAVGDIDMNGRFRVEMSNDMTWATVDFLGRVDVFPAFESYAKADDGKVVVVFTQPPKRGKTAVNLGGNAVRVVKGTARIDR